MAVFAVFVVVGVVGVLAGTLIALALIPIGLLLMPRCSGRGPRTLVSTLGRKPGCDRSRAAGLALEKGAGGEPSYNDVIVGLAVADPWRLARAGSYTKA
jgi:hypothetical protein